MVKAVVLGASGGIGQPLSLLCKISPLIDELSLFDVVNTPGVAADLSHISSRAKIDGYVAEKGDFKGEKPGTEEAKKSALTGADVVIIPAGVPRKPGMTRDDLFNINAGIVRDLIVAIAKYCPKASVLVISNPVNSTVPIAAEILKKHGVFDPKKLFGVTTLDVVRAETFIQDISGERNTDKVVIPVIGGHSGTTIVPLFSQAKPSINIPADKLDALVHRVQFGGDEVVAAKDGAGSATLSMAYAGFRFAESIIKAMKGEKGIVEPSYVYLPGVAGGEEIQRGEFLLVGVFGGDGEVEGGGEVGGVVGGGGGEVELGHSDGGDGEGGAVGVVEDVEEAGGDGGDEEEEDEEEDGPEAAEAEAASAAAAAAAVGTGLGAVGVAGGVVEV